MTLRVTLRVDSGGAVPASSPTPPRLGIGRPRLPPYCRTAPSPARDAATHLACDSAESESRSEHNEANSARRNGLGGGGGCHRGAGRALLLQQLRYLYQLDRGLRPRGSHPRRARAACGEGERRREAKKRKKVDPLDDAAHVYCRVRALPRRHARLPPQEEDEL
eukprot:scaffold278378_cov35-Tisochrysis_lutea.AAC.3